MRLFLDVRAHENHRGIGRIFRLKLEPFPHTIYLNYLQGKVVMGSVRSSLKELKLKSVT